MSGKSSPYRRSSSSKNGDSSCYIPTMAAIRCCVGPHLIYNIRRVFDDSRRSAGAVEKEAAAR